MGHDLDTLLNTTGIGGMAGKQFEKKASADSAEPFDLHKLADQCREAAESTVSHREAHGRELVEKTAAVAVISKTIDEINKIIGDPVEKIAADPSAIEFVHAALERGHAPEEIAVFLKNAGAVSFVRNLAGSARASLRHRAGSRLSREGKHMTDLAKQEHSAALRRVASGSDLNAQRKLVSKLRRKYGDKEAGNIISRSGAKLDISDVDDLVKSSPAASATIGGKTLKISKGTAKKVAPFAAGAAGAIALRGRSGNKSGDKSGGRVTVIRG